MGKLERSIDALFEGDTALSSDAAEKLLETMTKNYQISERKVFRRFGLILVVWLTTVVLANGRISDLSLLGFKFTDTTFVLAFLPLVASALFYGMIASHCSMTVYMDSMRQLILRIWPPIYYNNLEQLLFPASFLSFEIFIGMHLDEFWYKMDTWLKVIGLLMLVFGPVFILAHIHFVVLSSSLVGIGASVFLVAISAVLVLRALILIVYAVAKFGD